MSEFMWGLEELSEEHIEREEFPVKPTKRGRDKEESTTITENFFKQTMEGGQTDVRWALLRSMIVRGLFGTVKFVLGKDACPDLFKYDGEKEYIWAVIRWLIAANETTFEHLSEIPRNYYNLTNSQCRTIYQEESFRELHSLCMRVLFGDEETIPPARIPEISAKLNVYCREGVDREYWMMRLKKYLKTGMVNAVNKVGMMQAESIDPEAEAGSMEAEADSMIA